jgi:hypothetical protein
MLQQLLNLFITGTQMVGLTILAVGCLLFAAAIFSGRTGGFVTAVALILTGGYLAGFGASLH